MDYKYPIPLLILGVLITLVLIYSQLSQVYDIDLVISNPTDFAGQQVTLKGEVTPIGCLAPHVICPEDNPCCGSISCNMGFTGENGMIILRANRTNLACTGSNCEIACDIESGNYSLTGTITTSYGDVFLDVESSK